MHRSDPIRMVIGPWARLAHDAGLVRTHVFVEEQGIPAALEWDAEDEHCVHCVAYEAQRPIGTGRLLPDGHIGRMAVLPEYRDQGIGGRILRALMRIAAGRGDALLRLSAQLRAVPFYARHGFATVGEVYDEVGIAHQAMQRSLDGRVQNAHEATRAMPDGARLHTRDWAPVRPLGGGVYLLHGLGEHSGRYDALARWLCARGWRVRAHDHVGHGLSSGRRGRIASEAQLADHARIEIARFAEDLGAAPVLLGHSLGGALAAELVVHHRLPVNGLVLSSPALRTRMTAFQRALASMLGALAPGLAVGNGLDPTQLSQDEREVHAYREDPLVHDRVSARLVGWLGAAGQRALQAVPALACPTLMLVSGADRLVDPEGSRDFAQQAPPGRIAMRWYPDLRHELFNEKMPDRGQVLADLEQWLATTVG